MNELVRFYKDKCKVNLSNLEISIYPLADKLITP
jgi:hypothetical protein